MLNEHVCDFNFGIKGKFQLWFWNWNWLKWSQNLVALESAIWN